MKKIFAVILCLGLFGCASTGVVPMGKDTYMISKKSAQVGFGQPVGARADVYREANEFCVKQNKKLETVSCDMQNSGFARPGSVTLIFKCVNDNDNTSK